MSGAGARSREDERLKVRKWRGRELGQDGSLAGELGRNQELRKTYWRCAVQATLVHALFQPCVSLCLGVGWHVEGSGLCPKSDGAVKGAEVSELAGDGLLVRCSSLPLEVSEWVPESGIFAASHEVGGLPNPEGTRCLVRYLHVPHGCSGKVKGGQTPEAKNCRHFSSL